MREQVREPRDADRNGGLTGGETATICTQTEITPNSANAPTICIIMRLKRFHKHFDEKGEPNERRTPALLREQDYDRWLDASAEEAPGFFTTFGSDDLQAHAAPIVPVPKLDPHPRPVQRDLLLG